MAADTAEERLMAMQVLASLEGISKRLGATPSSWPSSSAVVVAVANHLEISTSRHWRGHRLDGRDPSSNAREPSDHERDAALAQRGTMKHHWSSHVSSI